MPDFSDFRDNHVSPEHFSPHAMSLFCDAMSTIETTCSLIDAHLAVSAHAWDEDPSSNVKSWIAGLTAQVRELSAGASMPLSEQIAAILFESGAITVNDDSRQPMLFHLPYAATSQEAWSCTAGLVFKHLAEELGLRVDGVLAGERFLLRVVGPGELTLLDPANQGRPLPDHELVTMIEERLNAQRPKHNRKGGRPMRRKRSVAASRPPAPLRLPTLNHFGWLAHSLKRLRSSIEGVRNRLALQAHYELLRVLHACG